VKRFKFSLEKVLKLRQHNEHEARVELGRAIGVLAGIENEIKRNAATRAAAIKERFASIGNGSDSGSGATSDTGYGGTLSMHAWDAYIHRLELEADQLTEAAARAETVVDEKRALYVEASRELKVMENLKERRAKEHRKEMFVEETKELDDRKMIPNI
jgi:flagellar FliJ protein